MPFSAAIEPKTEQVRAYIQASLATAGYEQSSVGWAFALDQYSFSAAVLPLTVVTPGELKFDTDVQGIGTTTYDLPLMIHHVRARSAADLTTFEVTNEEQVCQIILSSIVAAIAQDRRMGGIIQQCWPMGINIASKDEINTVFQAEAQNASLVAASLFLKITWNESIYS